LAILFEISFNLINFLLEQDNSDNKNKNLQLVATV